MSKDKRPHEPGIFRLGIHKPPAFTPEFAAFEALTWIRSVFTFEYSPEVYRAPEQNYHIGSERLGATAAVSWHQDCGRFGCGYLLLWSSALPTLIRNKETKERISLLANEIIIIDNRMYEHRARRRNAGNAHIQRHFIVGRFDR